MPSSSSNLNEAYRILSAGFGDNFAHGTPMEHVVSQLLQRIQILERRVQDLNTLVTSGPNRTQARSRNRGAATVRAGQTLASGGSSRAEAITNFEDFLGAFERPTHTAHEGEIYLLNDQYWVMVNGSWEFLGNHVDTNAALGDGEIAGALETQDSDEGVSALHPAHNSSFILKI